MRLTLIYEIDHAYEGWVSIHHLPLSNREEALPATVMPKTFIFPNVLKKKCIRYSILAPLSSLSNIGDETRPLAFSAAAAATGFAEAPAEEIGTVDLEKYVKSRLPGGFAAQKIFGTGRRKCAIARVVLQEGTGKFIINYRDAKVRFFSLFS